MTTSPLRIAVTGLAASYPFGGVFWDYLQYVLGFRRLGHDVLYVEDTGKWCYDPEAMTFVEDGARNAARLARHIAQFAPDLADCWFYRDGAGREYGRAWADVGRFCRGADLFLHVSASCRMREEYFAADRVAFLDSDPMYTQAGLIPGPDGAGDESARQWTARLGQHDVLFTFAENMGRPDCLIPSGPFQWIPTRQPVVLECFRDAAVPVAARRRVLTTVASWEPAEAGPVIGGVQYHGKSAEFERFLDLPARSRLPLEVALSGPAPLDRLQAAGWRIRPGYEVSNDPGVYRDYLARSFAECSVAKNAYVAGRTGWFSCRTACYLALGVPAIVQQTGFEHAIPTGRGLLAFSTPDEAAAAIEAVVSDPERHSAAAREIAAEVFDSDKVLSRLLDQAAAAPAGS